MNEKNKLTTQEKEELDILFKRARKADYQQSVHVSDGETENDYQKIEPRLKQAKDSSFSYTRYAAAAILLLGLIALGFALTPNRVNVANGTTQTVHLADGTTVTLNSGSSLSYPRWFNIWERTVSLEGEAFFEVTKSGQPFTVETENARITVMGTAFNVRTWSAEANHRTSVFLKEGKVSLTSKTKQSKATILKPGEMSSVYGNKAVPTQPKQVDSSKATAWMQNGLAFDNQPLSEIFDEISRRYDIEIRVENKRLLDETLTIYISEMKGAEQTLADICKVKNLKYAKNGDIFTISR